MKAIMLVWFCLLAAILGGLMFAFVTLILTWLGIFRDCALVPLTVTGAVLGVALMLLAAFPICNERG